MRLKKKKITIRNYYFEDESEKSEKILGCIQIAAITKISQPRKL